MRKKWRQGGEGKYKREVKGCREMERGEGEGGVTTVMGTEGYERSDERIAVSRGEVRSSD